MKSIHKYPKFKKRLWGALLMALDSAIGIFTLGSYFGSFYIDYIDYFRKESSNE